jgi:FAD/FMN-containing dehydrogenase
MDWDDYKKAFEFDGTWRDIYVPETELKDWKTLLEFLAEGHFPVRFLVNDTEQPLHTNVWQIFQDKKQDRIPLLWIDVAGVMLACHFFEQNEIEFDLDPREVTGEKHAQALLDFMKQIGDELDKNIFLTEEDAAEDIWFSYDPATGEITEYELY